MGPEKKPYNGRSVLEIDRALNKLSDKIIVVGAAPQDGEIHIAPIYPIFDSGKLGDFAADLIPAEMKIKRYGFPGIKKVGKKNVMLLPEHGLEVDGGGRVRAILYPSEAVAEDVLSGKVGYYTDSGRLAIPLQDLIKYAPKNTKFPRVS